MKIGLNYKNKKIKLNAENCTGFRMYIGLMFKSKENARALLFDFEKSCRKGIHSYFVSFPFVAIWINGDNKIIEIKKVEPWVLLVKPERPFVKLVEIPISEKYKEVTELLVGARKI